MAEFTEAAKSDLEDARDSLDEESDSLEGSIRQLADAAGAIGSTLAGGVEAVASIVTGDPQLAATVRSQQTCQTLQQERGR